MKKTYKLLIIILIVITLILANIPTKIYAKSVTCPVCGGTGTIPSSTVIKCTNCHGTGKVEQTGGERSKKTTSHSAGEIIDEAESFIEAGSSKEKISEENLQDLSGAIYNILLTVGIIIAVIVGLVLGIKFILGSVEQKAEIKTMLVPYIIGVVVIFGAFTIWKIVVDILQAQ